MAVFGKCVDLNVWRLQMQGSRGNHVLLRDGRVSVNFIRYAVTCIQSRVHLVISLKGKKKA